MFNDEEIKAMVSIGGMSALAAAVRCIIDNTKTLTFLVTTFVLCVFAGQIVWYIVRDMNISSGYKNAISLAACLCAREVIGGIIKASEVLRDNAVRWAQTAISKKFPQTDTAVVKKDEESSKP